MERPRRATAGAGTIIPTAAADPRGRLSAAAIAILILVAAASGCISRTLDAAPVATPAAHPDGPIGRARIDVGFGGGDASRDAHGDSMDGPNVTLNGERAGAIAIIVRDRDDSEPDGHRYACGGVVLTVVEGSADPRSRLAAWDLAYNVSYRVVDESNRSWVTDRYDDPAAPDDLSRSVFVATILGADSFVPDDEEGSCPPAEWGVRPYNAVVYLHEFFGRADSYFSPAERPPLPEERAWWTSEPPESWTA